MSTDESKWCLHCLIKDLLVVIAEKQDRQFTQDEMMRIISGCGQVAWETARLYLDKETSEEMLRDMIEHFKEKDINTDSSTPGMSKHYTNVQ